MKEQEILKFWEDNKIFEKSLNKKGNDFIFYDGPPFATGMPHYGHIIASVLKDVIPRYQTMKGKRVPRRWGWDCHGLPVENLIEKDLNLQSKKDIEDYGIEKFNKAAESIVLKYADEWKKIIPRIGRWVDMENDYRTMDKKYTESVWWVFKNLYEKDLIYDGYKSMHICPRCETTLSNFEVNQNYKDIKDISVFVKFELIEDRNTFILAWTTTPWTLPGNVALAVGEDIVYAKIKISDSFYILAKDRLEIIKDKYDLIEEFNGKDLIGKKYVPVFDYFSNSNIENKENGWKIYGADFVTTQDGTGVVHIAPAFGEDDMNLGRKNELPFIQHVSMSGKFTEEVTDFIGLYVKPKDSHQSTDVEIIKWLDKKKKLFAKENLNHSYPFCWRCDTPLLNYATSSWFVNVVSIKDKLLKNNKQINWVPNHLMDGRFGKWLESARDWAISRSRYWGAPLPIWRCLECGQIKVMGSIKDIEENSKKTGNKYLFLRHGESKSNSDSKISCNIEDSVNYPLTENGVNQVNKVSEKLVGEKIDFIFASDFFRTKQTAEIISKKIGVPIKFDERLREYNISFFNGKSVTEFNEFMGSEINKFTKTADGGETLSDVRKRMMNFVLEVEKRYSNKNILIVGHGDPLWVLEGAMIGFDNNGIVEIGKNYIQTGELRKVKFLNLPYSRDGVVDLHRPYIDEVGLQCNNCDGEMKRVLEVFDCWFESGSMPYGQAHYPFENKKEFEANFPAEFIAEGIDQTRGWFYTLLVLSTALFDKPAFKNVVVNGIILADDGQKMSKRLNNYPDPMEIVEKYGADSLRLYLLSNPVVRGESLNFSEKGVDEMNKKVISKLKNVLSFYEMYVNEPSAFSRQSSDNILDKWIIEKLNNLTNNVTNEMDKYELDKSVRPIEDFVDDLSNWYVRRSRDRFKEDGKDKNNAIATLQYVLLTTSKLLAPFVPFIAEDIYQSIKTEKNKESVHLEDWPKTKTTFSFMKTNIDKDMKEVRDIVALALELRAKTGLKVRQPLASLKIKSQKSNLKNNKELLQLIKDELNVKEIIFTNDIKENIELDIVLTQELIQEGMVRELVRKIQGMRKDIQLTPQDLIGLTIETDSSGEKLINDFSDEIKKGTNSSKINFAQGLDTEENKIENLTFKIKINK